MLRSLCAAFLVCVTFQAASAGEKSVPFKKLWATDVAGDVDDCFTTADGQYIYGLSDETVTSVDCSTGKTVGQVTIKNLFGAEECESAFSVSGSGFHSLLVNLGEDDDITTIGSVDLATMKKLWTVKLADPDLENSVYLSDLNAVAIPIDDSLALIDAASGAVKWKKPKFFGKIMRKVYLPDQKLILTVSYLPGGARNPGAKMLAGRTQVSCINIETGATLWENVYKMVNATLGSDAYQKDYVNIEVNGDQVILTLDYQRVIDLKTGIDLWKGRIATEQNWWTGEFCLEAQQLPLPIGNYTYTTNFNHDVFKTDRNTGEDAWKAEIPKSDYLPRLVVSDGVVVVQRGGYICKEEPIKLTIKFGMVQFVQTVGYDREWETNGPYGITALDDKTGKQIWATEKFKRGLTRLILDGSVIYGCSGDSMYALNIADGSAKFTVSHNDADLGETRWAIDGGDKIAVICSEGVCAYSKADGRRLWTTPVSMGIEDYLVRGKNVFVLNEEKTIAGIDIATGAVKGAFVPEDEDDPVMISEDGEQIITISENKLAKFAVNR